MRQFILTVFILMTICFSQGISGKVPVALLQDSGMQFTGSSVAMAYGTEAAQTSKKKEVKVSKDILEEYVGTYKLSPASNMIITLDGDKLMAQLSGAGKIELFASSETTFFPKLIDAEIEFVKDANGDVTHMLFRQSGGEIKGERISGKALKEVKLSPEILKKYTGYYRAHHGYEMLIERDGDKLYAEMSGGFGGGKQRLRLIPVSETKFTIKNVVTGNMGGRFGRPRGEVPGEIDFFVGKDGMATHLVRRQGPVGGTTFQRIGDKEVEEKGIEVSPEILSKYVGTYLQGPDGQGGEIKMNITLDGNHLSTQNTGQRKIRLLADSEVKFFPKNGSSEIEFVKDEKGQVIYLINRTSGMGMMYPRIGEKWEATDVEVSPEILSKYAGTYQMGPGFNLKISLKDGKLVGQYTNRPEEFELHAQSENRFYFPGFMGTSLIEFVKGDPGAVPQMFSYSAGMKMPVRRIGD